MKNLMTIAILVVLSGCAGEPVGVSNTNDTVSPVCGNGVVEPGEECDGTLEATCAGLGYTTGTLRCTDDCHFDTTFCTTCGDGVAEGSEFCDTGDFPINRTCVDLGFAGGNIACDSVCRGYDVSGCFNDPEPVCGNGITEGDEECDGDTFVTRNYCEDYGFDRGLVQCTNCQIDISGCFNDPTPAVCGNGVVEPGELCDGTAINDTCQTAGWTGGELRCTANCLTYDASDCWF